MRSASAGCGASQRPSLRLPRRRKARGSGQPHVQLRAAQRADGRRSRTCPVGDASGDRLCSSSGSRLSTESAKPAAKHPDLGPSTTTSTSTVPSTVPSTRHRHAPQPRPEPRQQHGTAEEASGYIAGAAASRGSALFAVSRAPTVVKNEAVQLGPGNEVLVRYLTASG
jgi:hypothetical protein